jgi:hypothetical protein
MDERKLEIIKLNFLLKSLIIGSAVCGWLKLSEIDQLRHEGWRSRSRCGEETDD